MYDYIIVGAGLFGATFAYLATKAGKRCLVIDRRSHPGGNLYCEEIEGINVHKYGAHIFHTSDCEVWNLVTGLTPFNRYTNCPVAKAPDGNLYNLPFNMNTFNRLWGLETPQQVSERLDQQRSAAIEKMQSDGVTAPRNLEEQALTLIGRDVYELLIKGYTEKQWGRKCSELPPFIIKRLPVRLTFDNNYFNDLYQGIPIGGYNRLIDAMLNGSDFCGSEDFFARPDYWRAKAKTLVFTGAIDQYYQYQFGRLEYRTVSFETEVFDTPNYQGNAVINYTSAEVPFTRIIEHKHFESFGDAVYDNSRTVISREYPAEFVEGKSEPFYPVNDERNNAIYEKYQKLARDEQNVIFGGRLAEYRYMDMAPVIRKAIDIFNTQA